MLRRRSLESLTAYLPIVLSVAPAALGDDLVCRQAVSQGLVLPPGACDTLGSAAPDAVDTGFADFSELPESVDASSAAPEGEDAPEGGGCPYSICCCQALCAYASCCEEDGWSTFCVDLAASNAAQLGGACSATPPTPSVSFSAAPYTQSEGTVLTVALNLSNCSSATVSVAFATSNGTATAGSDYTTASGTRTWLPGDTSPKTFMVPISADGVLEPTQSFTLTLSSPSGCTISAPNPTSVTIVDATLGAPNNLIVSSYNGDAVQEYSWPSGVPVGPLVAAGSGGLDGPRIARLGPNGNLFVPSWYTWTINQYAAATGAPLGTFVTPPPGAGPPFGQAWGPNGNLFVSRQGSMTCVEEYSGVTGASVDTFQCMHAGEWPYNLHFRSNGNLLISDFLADQIREYSLTTDTVVRTYSGGGLDGPEGVTVGPNGNVFVCSSGTNQVIQYNGSTGALVSVFATLGSSPADLPIDLAFGPNGNLFVTCALTNQVRQFNGSTGAAISVFVTPGNGGLSGPSGLCFRPPAIFPVPVDILAANPPLDNPFVAGPQPFRDVLQDWTMGGTVQGIGGAGTPSEDSVTYSSISVTLSGPPLPPPIVVQCTDVTGNGAGDCPTVTGISGSGGGPYVVTLSAAIPPRECVTIELGGVNPAQKLQYQSLPGDVNMSGATSAADVVALIAGIGNGDAGLPANLPHYDINRSGAVAGADALRLVQLLNGIGTMQPWTGATVADCP